MCKEGSNGSILLKQTDAMRKHAKDEGIRLDLITPTKSTSPKFGTDLLRPNWMACGSRTVLVRNICCSFS
jgi:hypothetical protein